MLVGETHSQTLTREIREECGAEIARISRPYGKIIEYDTPFEPEYSVFKMTSYYYLCQVKPAFFDQSLDLYEREMGFQPAWINIEEALRINKAAASSDQAGKLRWITREIYLLELLQRETASGLNS